MAGCSTLKFENKVAIVTGGCQGIGKGCVDVLGKFLFDLYIKKIDHLTHILLTS